MKKARVGFLYDQSFLNHDTGAGHPEHAGRLEAIVDAIRCWNRGAELQPLAARPATAAEIALVHDPYYVQRVEDECRLGRSSLSTGDTAIGGESFAVALRAAGGVLSAVDEVLGGRLDRTFCAVRPPGHHASADRGRGFCIFNNVALAARHAQKKHGLERIVIADWDVHHGNGTQEIFYQDDSVLFMSTHQWPLYPGTGAIDETGAGRGLGFTINRPFAAGAGNREIVGAFRDELLPAARRFRPDLTLISAGFDSRAGDPLGGFRVDDDGFRELTRLMLEMAAISGSGRLISVLEGGYDPAGLASAVLAHLEEMLEA